MWYSLLLHGRSKNNMDVGKQQRQRWIRTPSLCNSHGWSRMVLQQLRNTVRPLFWRVQAPIQQVRDTNYILYEARCHGLTSCTNAPGSCNTLCPFTLILQAHPMRTLFGSHVTTIFKNRSGCPGRIPHIATPGCAPPLGALLASVRA